MEYKQGSRQDVSGCRIVGCYFMLENKLDIYRNSYTCMFTGGCKKLDPLFFLVVRLSTYRTKNGLMLHFHYEVLTGLLYLLSTPLYSVNI